MKIFENKKNKKFQGIVLAIIALIIVIGSLFIYFYYKQPEKVVKVPPKKTTYNLSSIGLSIKNDGYLFTTKDNGYKKLKASIEEVLNNVEKPGLETNTIPDTSDKKHKKEVSVENLKNSTVNVGSIIYIDGVIKTKIKATPELEHFGTSDVNGNLVIPAHEFVIILSGEYKGLLLTRSTQDAERWSAWEVGTNSIQELTELVRRGIK